MIRWLVDRYHVSTLDSEIEEDFRKRCKKARKKGADISAGKEEEIIEEAIGYHHENIKLYTAVMSGSF